MVLPLHARAFGESPRPLAQVQVRRVARQVHQPNAQLRGPGHFPVTDDHRVSPPGIIDASEYDTLGRRTELLASLGGDEDFLRTPR